MLYDNNICSFSYAVTDKEDNIITFEHKSINNIKEEDTAMIKSLRFALSAVPSNNDCIVRYINRDYPKAFKNDYVQDVVKRKNLNVIFEELPEFEFDDVIEGKVNPVYSMVVLNS